MFGNYTNPYATNPYAVQYQPQMQQNQPNQQMMQNSQQMQYSNPLQNNNSIIWVQGEAGAKSYLIAPNTSLLLMDSEGEYFYIKSTDNTGMPTLRRYEYKEITDTASKLQKNAANNDVSFDPNKYITREEFDEFTAKFSQIKDNSKTKKKEVEE